MNVVVDTSVWSLALRRHRSVAHPATLTLARAVSDGRVVMLGAIRQEVLSGIREAATFGRLRERLRAFPDAPLLADDHERAAEFFNTCRGKGIQGANTDFLICAAAHRLGCEILTTDEDFVAFAGHVPVTLAGI